ncbi:MAG: hypothetical protein JWQ16_3450 [Novosphingobium sp.]|nr:hypothetical protein [Novosphingobium sp.]
MQTPACRQPLHRFAHGVSSYPEMCGNHGLGEPLTRHDGAGFKRVQDAVIDGPGRTPLKEFVHLSLNFD